MRYLVLATDFDGTLACDGRVAPKTIGELERLIASGRKLVLVTGRELEDLLTVFPQAGIFEWVVAENGALQYNPATKEKKYRGESPPERFVRALQERGVTPLSVGNVIVSTSHPNETTVLEVIRDLGLEMQLIFNKGAVMILPTGINKATGLTAALDEMAISAHNTVGIGDAENDHAFFRLCECAVAVANALPTVKEKADFVTGSDNGAGVIELIGEIIEDDLRKREARLTRHHIPIGQRESGEEVRVQPYGSSLLLAGSSGGGKSTLATGILERLSERDYQFCVIDPEGDYGSFEEAVTLGSNNRPPDAEEVIKLLRNPHENAVVNLLGVPLKDRPEWFATLLPRLRDLRVRKGHPHWLVVDEAHHVLPASWEPASLTLPKEFDTVIFVTVEPKSLTPAVLSAVDTLIAVGDEAERVLREVAQQWNQPIDSAGSVSLGQGEVIMWRKGGPDGPFKLRLYPSRSERRRHRRKYAEGDLGPERSFYFEGPDRKLNLKAQNLFLFNQIAEGVDDDTWNYHLKRGDYSEWFRDMIKDEILAAEAERIRNSDNISPRESRAAIKKAIDERYTLPASKA